MMMRWLVGLLVSLLCAMAPTRALLAAEEHDWTVYRNHRYGFSIEYPADVFEQERATEADDGQSFVSRGGDARLLVGTISNAERFGPEAYRDHLAKEFYTGFVTTYRSLGPRSFALLGESKDKSFYERVMLSCDGKLISSFAILYPSDQGILFFPLLEVIEKSFQPGFATTCSSPPRREQRRPR
jgi:hypothetical protein